MKTLDELIHYCNEKNPIGALMLTGEYGCGKTYLVGKELAGALKDSHFIVRVSLFGVYSAKDLHAAVRQKWMDACLPGLESLQKAKDRGFASALTSVLKKFSPVAGGAADVMVSMNVLDLITIKPEVEDFRTHEKKRVVLVYDDLERSGMGAAEVMGVINEYCENRHFNSIVIVSDDALLQEREKNKVTYQMIREKAVAQILHHIPDYDAVINAILAGPKWQSEEYAAFLTEHEELIRDAFISDSEKKEKSFLAKRDRKYHNFRTLTKGLQSFYRIYYHLNKLGYDVTDERLYSFLAYYLVAKCGICREGMPCIDFEDKDIKEFYPEYSPEALTDTEKCWISTGIWDSDAFAEEESRSHR